MSLRRTGGIISLREGIEAALQKHSIVDCLRRAQDGRESRATPRDLLPQLHCLGTLLVDPEVPSSVHLKAARE